MTDDISPVARTEYDAGITPLDYAEGQIAGLISAHLGVTLIPADLGAAAIVTAGSPAELARYILGALLDAGWHPPVYPIPEPEVTQ